MDIGFIGLGEMGAAMVANMLKAGHSVRVWNRSPDKAQPLVELGAQILLARLCSLVQDDGATPPPAAVDASEDSAATGEYYDHVAYEYDGLHDPFVCATPDLWDTWPLLEWNAVA